MEFNSDRALFFALQRLDSPGMRLEPEQVPSTLAVCKGKDMKDVFVWLLTGFGKSVCYEATPFVMDCKLRRVDSESGKYSSSPGLVLVQYVTSSSTWIGNVICPSSSVLAWIIMRMCKQWIPGPSFSGGSGLGTRLEHHVKEIQQYTVLCWTSFLFFI